MVSIVVQEIHAGAQRVRARLVREIVDDLVQIVDAAGGRTGERAERGDAGDADRRADRDRSAAPAGCCA